MPGTMRTLGTTLGTKAATAANSRWPTWPSPLPAWLACLLVLVLPTRPCLADRGVFDDGQVRVASLQRWSFARRGMVRLQIPLEQVLLDWCFQGVQYHWRHSGAILRARAIGDIRPAHRSGGYYRSRSMCCTEQCIRGPMSRTRTYRQSGRWLM
jgi:hypothetical protein